MKSFKRKETLQFATTGMDPEGIMQSDLSEWEKYIYCIFSLVYGIKKKMKFIGTENRLVVSRGRG